jgi:RNA polymerase sigma factor (sigma-70 family)
MSHPVLRNYLRLAADDPTGPADTDLLARFARSRDEAAFEVLVWRHAGLVQRVCRGVLGDHHAAEDAAQAAFLILARKAHAFADHRSVVGWLYRIARQVAIRLAKDRTCRATDPVELDRIPAAARAPATPSDEVETLCAEVDRLPERYRVPVLLCFFEGLTHAEAARRTGWPVGTVAGRLARAKERLARRLSNKGVGVATVVLAVPAGAFVGNTARAAIVFATGGVVGPGIEPTVSRLAEGGLEAMTTARLKLAGAAPLVCLGLVAVLGALFGAPAGDKSRPGADAPKKSLSFPGPDADPVIDFLGRIRDGRAATERVTGDRLIRGRVSVVNVDGQEGAAEHTAATLPAPDWFQFLLVQRGRKRRFDCQFFSGPPGSEQLATAYRLLDGKAFYKLDAKTLEISPPVREQGTWEGLAAEYFAYGQGFDGRNYGPLADVCRTLIDQVKQGEGADHWKDRVLRCYEEDGLLVVENTAGQKSKSGSTIWVDPRRGYQVVRRRDERGGPGQNVHYGEDCRIELVEAAPSVFLPKRATMFVFDLGSVAKRDRRAGWARRDMDVTSMKVGKINYDDRLFELASLPVPKDVIVTDHRR